MPRHRVRVPLACAALFVLGAGLLVAADNPDPSGRPKGFEKGKRTAFAVWEDDGVWHLRTAVKADAKGKAQRIQFSGTVTIQGDRFAGGQFQGLDKKNKAKDADWVFPHANDRGFDFQFSTLSSNVDGISFKVGPKAESVTFKLLTAGDDDPKRIMIGAKGVHPPKAEIVFPVNGK